MSCSSFNDHYLTLLLTQAQANSANDDEGMDNGEQREAQGPVSDTLGVHTVSVDNQSMERGVVVESTHLIEEIDGQALGTSIPSMVRFLDWLNYPERQTDYQYTIPVTRNQTDCMSPCT
jgi:hypothetical protein